MEEGEKTELLTSLGENRCLCLKRRGEEEGRRAGRRERAREGKRGRGGGREREGGREGE